MSSPVAAIPAQRVRRHKPAAQVSSATPLAYTRAVFAGRNPGTIEVNVEGCTRWITPLTLNAAATSHGDRLRHRTVARSARGWGSTFRSMTRDGARVNHPTQCQHGDGPGDEVGKRIVSDAGQCPRPGTGHANYGHHAVADRGGSQPHKDRRATIGVITPRARSKPASCADVYADTVTGQGPKPSSRFCLISGNPVPRRLAR
jgi:hypothetical protein